MWLSIKERRHCLLDFPEKCSDDKFVHANAAQLTSWDIVPKAHWRKGILYRRDNGLDNKTVPSRFGPLHPFSFSKILKSRNRNFNPAHPNESSDVRHVTLILEFRYWWRSVQIIHQLDHRQNLWLDLEPRVTIGVA